VTFVNLHDRQIDKTVFTANFSDQKTEKNNAIKRKYNSNSVVNKVLNW